MAWGNVYGGSGLPRAFDTFRAGSFGPFEPIQPNPIDAPQETGRPRPRRFQYPVGWNLPVGQPGTEGIKLANFQILRDISEVSSLCQTALNNTKADLQNLEWDIIPTKTAAKGMEGKPTARADFEARRAEALAFWNNPDPDAYDGFDEWFNAVLEDFLVLDAVALHMQPSRGGKGSGPFGCGWSALEVLDGSTVRPLLNTYGTRPKAPEPGYQQLIWGVPRVDLMDIINLGPDATIQDLIELNPLVDELNETIDEWKADQVMYIRSNPRSMTPYGFGPVEQSILPASIFLARQQWQWEFFKAGSLPAVFLDPGEMVATPEEARQLQEAINMLGGDLANKHQVIVTPPGAKVNPQKEVDLSSQFDEWVVATFAMTWGLSIADFGITPKVASMSSPAASRGAAQQANDRSTNKATRPRADKLKKKLFDRVLQVLWGQEDMQWSWGIEEGGDTKDALVKQHVALVQGSIESIDEGREALELEPMGLPETQVPMAFPATGPVPLGTSVATAEANLDNLRNGSPGLPDADGITAPAKPFSAEEPGDTMDRDNDGALTPAHAGAQDVLEDQGAKPQETGDVAKMLTAEAEVLKRYLKKGKALSDFVPKALRPGAVRAGRPAAERGDIDGAIKTILKVHKNANRRDGILDQHRKAVAVGLGAIVNKVRQGTLSAKAAVPQARAVMETGYQNAIKAGKASAIADFGNDSTDAAAVDPGIVAAALADDQVPFLADVLNAAIGGSSLEGLGNSVDMNADTLTSAYEQGYVGSAGDITDGAILIIWHAEDDACDLCADRDGQEYSPDDLPGWPGDGGFGDLCEGGPRCRCELEVAQSGDTGTNALRDVFDSGALSPEMSSADHAQQYLDNQSADIASMPDTPDAGGTSVQDRAQERENARMSLAAEQGVNPQDVSADDIADRVPAGMKRKKPVALVDKVHSYLAENYPEKHLDWVDEASWTMNDSVPLEDVDMDRRPGGRDMKKVHGMAKAIKDGTYTPDPVVLVDDGSGTHTVADGYHRTLALRHVGKTSTAAFVGRPKKGDTAWRTKVIRMHRDKLNKRWAPYIAALKSGAKPGQLALDAEDLAELYQFLTQGDPP